MREPRLSNSQGWHGSRVHLLMSASTRVSTRPGSFIWMIHYASHMDSTRSPSETSNSPSSWIVVSRASTSLLRVWRIDLKPCPISSAFSWAAKGSASLHQTRRFPSSSMKMTRHPSTKALGYSSAASSLVFWLFTIKNKHVVVFGFYSYNWSRKSTPGIGSALYRLDR